jgi:hypothetical protein
LGIPSITRDCATLGQIGPTGAKFNGLNWNFGET